MVTIPDNEYIIDLDQVDCREASSQHAQAGDVDPALFDVSGDGVEIPIEIIFTAFTPLDLAEGDRMGTRVTTSAYGPVSHDGLYVEHIIGSTGEHSPYPA